ncbi:unannotated protein [freshwater metagenome]|uniref:Unannotated protein n=1 Tax=freshwater metagenome TaxID=449393 RepID=A0A6J6EDY5_9ZZZZ
MATPPLETGAFHERATWPSPGAGVRFVGADGVVNGVTAMGAVAAPVPPAVIAETRK